MNIPRRGKDWSRSLCSATEAPLGPGATGYGTTWSYRPPTRTALNGNTPSPPVLIGWAQEPLSMYVLGVCAKPRLALPALRGFRQERRGHYDAQRIPRPAEEQEHTELPVRAFKDRWATGDASGIAAGSSRRPGWSCDYRGHACCRGEALARIGSQATHQANGLAWTMAS